MTLEDIGEGDDALLCMTNFNACCRTSYTETGSTLGHWYFPNGSEVPSSGEQWDFYRTRGQSEVLLNHRRGGVAGIYRCEIPDSANVTQSIYIGVYTAGTGELYSYSIVILTVLRDAYLRSTYVAKECQVQNEGTTQSIMGNSESRNRQLLRQTKAWDM